MGNLRKIFEDTALLSTGNIAVSGINFVTFLVMWNALGSFGFGMYTLALSVLSFATFFLDAGFSKVIVSDVSKEISKKNDSKAAGLFQGYTLGVMLITTIGALITFGFSGLIAEYLKNDITGLIRLIAGLIFLNGLKNIILTSFEITSKFKKYTFFKFFEATIKLILIFGILTYIGTSVENALLAIFVADFFLILLFIFQIPKKIIELIKTKNAEKKLFITMVKKHGKWAALLSQTRSFESNILFWIVEFFLGVNAVGIFAGLIKIQTLIIRLFEPLETIFYPAISKFGEIKNSTTIIFKATKFTFYLSIPLILILMIFPEPIITFILGKELLIYKDVFRIMLLTVFVVILNTPMKPIFFNLKEQKTLAIISVIYLSITLVTAPLFITTMGLIGAATSRVLSPLADLTMKIFSLKKKKKEICSIKELVLLNKEDIRLIKKNLFSFFGNKLKR